MRKLLPLMFVLLPSLAMAQKNAIKVNLPSLAIRNYHVQYERKILPKITLNLGVRIMPKGSLPMQSTLEKYAGLDDPDLELGKFEIGNTAFTLEPRFYLSKKAMKGFYIAPYARYATFDLTLPFKYTYNDPATVPPQSTTKTALFNGKVNSFSGGLMFGTQFNLGKRVVLDIWWLGGHFGSSNGDLRFDVALPTQEERTAVENSIKDFDPSPFKIKYQVGPNGAVIESDGPWAGIRALGVNLGIRF
ncbi:MAG TPA: DUF3575 domain-containing protein [Chitinophagaceae bacterium]